MDFRMRITAAVSAAALGLAAFAVALRHRSEPPRSPSMPASDVGPSSTVVIEVVDAEGRPAPDVRVGFLVDDRGPGGFWPQEEFADESPHLSHRAETDGLGRASFSRIPPGRYRGVAVTEGGAAKFLLAVAADVSQQVVRVRLALVRRLSFRVIDESGRGVADALVALVDPDSESTEEWDDRLAGQACFPHGVTDAAGRLGVFVPRSPRWPGLARAGRVDVVVPRFGATPTVRRCDLGGDGEAIEVVVPRPVTLELALALPDRNPDGVEIFINSGAVSKKIEREDLGRLHPQWDPPRARSLGHGDPGWALVVPASGRRLAAFAPGGTATITVIGPPGEDIHQVVIAPEVGSSRVVLTNPRRE
ncbi:MAG: hypothetical protein R3F20_06455 [Planctomycetota bacterium]